MRGPFSLITLICLGSLLTIVAWYVFDGNIMESHNPPSQNKRAPNPGEKCKGCSSVEPHKPPSQKKGTPEPGEKCKDCSSVEPHKPPSEKKGTPEPGEKCKDCSKVEPPKPPPQKKSTPEPVKLCKGCKEIIDKVTELYSQSWRKQEDNYQKLKSQLSSKCNGSELAIITQANTALGTKIVYDGERKRSIQVTQEIFNTFIKERPFPSKTFDTCAVVGNGGILTNSSCGKMIDSAQFVIRCNLPPLENGYEKHVGIKTDLVTANPSIFLRKYGALNGRRRPFADSLHPFGNSLLLLPAFSFGMNTQVSMRAVYTVEDFESPIRPVFFNPEYLYNLAVFWRSQGLKPARLTTGIMMTSLALELCSNVHLYGFWPFDNHPHGLHVLSHHYYDDINAKRNLHAMPAEFNVLLQLHTQGVLRLHLGECGEK